MKIKILYVSTLSNTINRFLIPHIELLLDQGHHVDIACNIDREIDPRLTDRGCKIFDIKFQRSPITKSNYFAYKEIKNLVFEQKYDIVHTHTPVASFCVRLACKKLKNVKVIYTAHGFHFYKGAPIKNWLIYYPLEYWLSKYTDVLITINEEDYTRAKKSFRAQHIKYIPGVGIDTKESSEVIVEGNIKRREIGIDKNAFIILSVGELNKNKNHETVIKAIAKLNNSNVHYLICGKGPLKKYLLDLITEHNLNPQVRLLGYRKDIIELCNISDIFVFPSFREGLSVALMEAMACGLPIVCSDIRGNRDLIQDGKGGFLVNPIDVEGFVKSINNILSSRKLNESMCNENKTKIEKFNIENVLYELNEIFIEYQRNEVNNFG